MLFGWAALDTWVRRYDRSRPHFAVQIPGNPTVDSLFTVCLNTDPYTFVGARPFTLAPAATLDRGLAVVSLRTLDLVPLVGVLASALGSGARLRRSPHVSHHTDVTDVLIDGFGPVPYQVDGDYLGDLERLEIRHEPAVLRVVIPR